MSLGSGWAKVPSAQLLPEIARDQLYIPSSGAYGPITDDEGLPMTMPIEAYGLLVALFGLIAIGSGIWLVMRARDVAKLADTPDSDVAAGRTRRPPASSGMTRSVLIIAILSTLAALGTFALVATRAVDSDNTRTDANAQRP